MGWSVAQRWGPRTVAAALLAAVAGCGRSLPPSSGGPASPDRGAVAAHRAASAVAPQQAAGVTLRETDAAALDHLLSQQVGKVALVDFWATWCLPCREGLPKVLALGTARGADHLAVISVSLDDPAQSEEVLAFLRSIGAAIPNLISAWGAGTESLERFGIPGGLPYCRLYDRRGQMRFQFGGDAAGASSLEPLDQLPARLAELLDE